MRMTLRVLRVTSVATGLALGVFLGGCDPDDDDDDTANDDAADTAGEEHGEEHGEHGEHGDDDDDDHEDHGDDTAGAEAALEWLTPPPETATAGTPFRALFSVETEDEIHVTEIRVCEGADVEMCGHGGEESFDSNFPAPDSEGGYEGEVTLDAGEYTVVGYAHIGPDPFTTHGHTVTVE